MDKSHTKLSWHMGKTEEELKFVDFEFLFWRTYYSWIRWQEDCQNAISDDYLTAYELAILHVTRMKERPKTVYEVARLLNRDDIPNLQYGIKKLIDLKYLEKVDVKDGPKKAIAYQATQKGIDNTNAFAKAREELLVQMLRDYKALDVSFDEANKVLTLMKSMFEEASRRTFFYENEKK